MQFPMGSLCDEQIYKLCSDNVCGAFDNISRIELVPKQVAVSWHRIIPYYGSKQTVVEEFQNENYSFKM